MSSDTERPAAEPAPAPAPAPQHAPAEPHSPISGIVHYVLSLAIMRCPESFLRKFSAQLLEEYKRFIVLKVVEDDVSSEEPKIRQSAQVDAVWHEHMLLPTFYVDMCRALNTPVIYHNPDTEHQTSRDESYRHTRERYEQVFGETPNAAIWPAERTQSPDDMIVFVKTLTGAMRTIKISKTATILALKKAVEQKEGVSPCQQRLIFAGRLLEDERTLEHYNIMRESTVHMVLRLSGC